MRKRHRAPNIGSRTSERRGTGIDYCDFREFVQGDDPRLLDWALFARTDRLFVKLFEEEGDLTLHLLIDLSRSMRFGDPGGLGPDHPISKLGRALRCAAAVGHVALHGLDRVRAHLFDRAIFRSSRPLRGPSAFSHLVEFLSLHATESIPRGEGTDLCAVASAFCNSHSGTGICLLISDFLDPAWERALAILAGRRHDLHIIQIGGYDERLDLPSGEYELFDAETGVARAVRLDPTALEEQRRSFEHFRNRIRAFCKRCGIGCAISTPHDTFEETVFQTLLDSGLVGMK